jgi:uncharacterized protein (DUF1810 family)
MNQNNLSMELINKDFVYNKFPKTKHDVSLLEAYKRAIVAIDDPSIEQVLNLLPVDEKRKDETGASHLLTQFGFMALSIDAEFMNRFYRSWCRLLLDSIATEETLIRSKLHLLQASLIEFAILGSMEAQTLLEKLNVLYGAGNNYIESIVNERCPNLMRFLNAHAGSGRGVNDGDEVSSYEQALKEVRAGGKRTHWIWYIFPQMACIKGTHSRPALFYGIRGRLEAYQYINHPTLRHRLIEITEAILDNERSVYEIFGNDTMKVRASILLFASVSDIPVLKRMISTYRW